MAEGAGVEKFGLLKLVKSSAAQSGWCGVRPAPKNKKGEGKWQAYLTVGGKKRGLEGLYEDPRDAAIQLAVKKKDLELAPDGAWSEDEDENAPSRPRAPRGALCLLCPLRSVCTHPLHSGSPDLATGLLTCRFEGQGCRRTSIVAFNKCFGTPAAFSRVAC
jgi:hypothetical protein